MNIIGCYSLLYGKNPCKQKDKFRKQKVLFLSVPPDTLGKKGHYGASHVDVLVGEFGSCYAILRGDVNSKLRSIIPSIRSKVLEAIHDVLR